MRLEKFLLALIVCFGIGCSDSGDDNSGSDGGSPSNNACSDLNLPTKIINGTPCGNLLNSPVVRLVLIDPLGQQSVCSGSMITKKVVLTAGHCFLFSPTRVLVIYGNSLATGTAVEAESWNVHPGFTGSDNVVFNDVAVVRLPQDLPLPTLPILISSSVEPGDIISIFGYGTDENGNIDFENLESGQMRVAAVTSAHIRADFNGEGSNTCQGDSGGPATFVINGVTHIVGLTSSGTIVECLEGDNSFFANIQNSSILAFLQNNVPNARYR